MTIEITVAISVFCTILSVSLSCATFLNTRRKDNQGDGKSTGTIISELGYIKSSVDDIKMGQREQRKTNTEMLTRLTKVESSTKQAHKRLDTIEGKERT